MGEPVLLSGLGQFLGVEQVLDGLGILVEGTVGQPGVKLGDEPGLELLTGLLERGEGDVGLVLKQPHAGQFVIGHLELGVDLEDGLEVGGRLFEFVELALDAAKHEQRALVGGAFAQDGLELLGGVLGLIRSQVKICQLLANSEQAGVQLDQLDEQGNGLVALAPDLVVVSQAMKGQRVLRIEGAGPVEAGDDAGLDFVHLGAGGEAGVAVQVGQGEPEFRIEVGLGERGVEHVERFVEALGRSVELGQAIDGYDRRVRQGQGGLEGGDGLVRLAGLLIGEAKPLVHCHRFRVGRLAKAKYRDGLVGFFLLEKTPCGPDDGGSLRGVRLGGGLKVLQRGGRLASELEAAAGDVVGETLDAVSKLRIFRAGFLLDIDAVNAGWNAGSRLGQGHS